MPVDLSGKWESVRVQNMLEFMDEFDAEIAARIRSRGGPILGAKMEVEQSGEQFKIKTQHGDIVTEVNFSVGQETQLELFSGRKVKGTANWVGDKLVMTTVDEKGDDFVMTREIVDGEQIATLTAHGITAKTFYKRA